jgi:hypothetical protein
MNTTRWRHGVSVYEIALHESDLLHAKHSTDSPHASRNRPMVLRSLRVAAYRLPLLRDSGLSRGDRQRQRGYTILLSTLMKILFPLQVVLASQVGWTHPTAGQLLVLPNCFSRRGRHRRLGVITQDAIRAGSTSSSKRPKARARLRRPRHLSISMGRLSLPPDSTKRKRRRQRQPVPCAAVERVIRCDFFRCTAATNALVG